MQGACYRDISRKTDRQASRVLPRSSSVWAKERKRASNCEGAMYMDRLSMPEKNRVKSAVSLLLAVGKFPTGPSVKKKVNIAPT